MNGLFLHLDEELTNRRAGHAYPSRLSARDIAIALQLYSLLCRRVYIPVNFLTDSRETAHVLRRLGASGPTSALRAKHTPVRILWDETRYPYASLSELVGAMIDGAVEDVSTRSHQSLRDMEALASLAFQPSQYVRCRPEWDRLNNRIITRLHRDHFDVQANVKFDPRHAGLFGDVLHQLVELPIGRTWSRDVFYSAFGYGNSTFARELAGSGREILRPVVQLDTLAQHRFLASVDYAAHAVKGEAYGPAVRGGLGVLMPHQFREYFRHVREATLSRTEVSVRLPEHVQVDTSTLPGIRADRLLGMTAAQLDLLRESEEFTAYRHAYDIFLAYPRESRGEGLPNLQAALVAYLRLVSRVLMPPLDRLREDAGALMVEGRFLRSGAKLLLQVLGPGAASIELLVQPLELVSKYLDRADSVDGLLTASQERRYGLDTAIRLDDDLVIEMDAVRAK